MERLYRGLRSRTSNFWRRLMAARKVRQIILFTTFLGIAGLGVVMPELAMAQVQTTISQSAELAALEKINQQIIQLYQQGKYSEAIPIAEKLLEMSKRLLGNEHPEVATSLNNLA